MTTRRRQIARPRRFGQSSAAAAIIPVSHSALLGLVDRVRTLPVIDQLLGLLLAHPRLLQLSGVLLGVVLIALTLHPLVLPTQGSTSLLAPTVASQPSTVATNTEEQAVIQVITAYNQASITAAVLNRAQAMTPYLATDGRTWADVQNEYQRRASTGETHNPVLTRWGILRVTVDAEIATVETQEQWDDLTSIGGQVISSQRGILTKNSYTLQRSPTTRNWLIIDITTTTVIG